MTVNTPIKALALVCSLKASPAPSSSEHMARQVLDRLEEQGVEGTIVRIADHDVKPGVEIDMGDGDAWPSIREQVMQSHILLIATPIWVGHPSSIAQRVMERLDAELSEADDAGRMQTYGKVGLVAVVGNEDGAHKVCADMMQGLSDLGFTVPANGGVYWVGEAMQKKDYLELDEVPKPIVATMRSMTVNAAHLARLLAEHQYPSTKD